MEAFLSYTALYIYIVQIHKYILDRVVFIYLKIEIFKIYDILVKKNLPLVSFKKFY